jgi:hypothetical protein
MNALFHGLPLMPELIMAIMEIEAWFLAESTHFFKIDEKLTSEFIESRLGFNPATEHMESRDQPSQDLHNVYSLVGLAYSKSRRQVERTVDALDLRHLVEDVGLSYAPFMRLAGSISTFLGA